MNYYSIVPHQVIDVRGDLDSENLDWSVTHMGLDKLVYKGEGQLVGVLDTGCDVAHPDLQGQVDTHNFISAAGDAIGDRSHGTFVCSQIVGKSDGKGIVGAAPKAKVYHGKVLYGTSSDMNRRSIDGDIADGIYACVAAGCNVISMSLGGPSFSTMMCGAIDYAENQGVIVVCAAGNERLQGSPYKSYPAACFGAVSVAAANKQDMPAWFSTTGVNGATEKEQPEVAIASQEFYWGCLPDGRYGRMIGTSMAAPTLAAVATLWYEARTTKGTLPAGALVLDSFREWLHRVSDDVNNNGWDPELGYGTLLLSDEELSTFGD